MEAGKQLKHFNQISSSFPPCCAVERETLVANGEGD
jgi:hypothetical protein